ncbi:MAG: SpoIID/LytB domain-containing protein [Cyanobacteriota bacterium]|nr:SpoIID/LytB domain-containing protein [Cyanobacteriota bacterium]
MRRSVSRPSPPLPVIHPWPPAHGRRHRSVSFLQRRLGSLLLGLPLLLAGGCRAAGPPSLPDPPEPLHWPVGRPPAIDPQQPVLWVGLAAHLRPPVPLVFKAAAGLLTLVAPDGARYQAPRLELHWRLEPMEPPLRLRRQVLGSFASYESAQQAADRWRQAGARVVIARPLDWEVWAPLEAPEPPAELGTVRRLERDVSQRAVLELRRADGAVRLAGPLTLEAPQGLYWQSGVFAGPFRLQPDAHGSWALVEKVPLERYLQGVVPHEIGAASPPAALAAQAVLARTWALRNLQRFEVDGYHLCADTQCQVYADPRHAGAAVLQAIASTRHQVLSWQGEPIHAVYHATNGGISAGFEEVWSGAPLPYLRARVDGPAPVQARFPLPLAAAQLPVVLASRSFIGADHPRFRWSRTVEAAQLRQAVQPLAPGLGLPTEVRVLERGASGRVMALEIRDGDAERVVLRRDAIRRNLRQLPSTLFLVEPQGPGRWRFVGGGFGHGAGLSQAGAIDLAARGWSLEAILQHYYPGTTLQPLSSLQPEDPGGAP